MSETIRRRSLPDSLRYLADKLDSNTLTDAERLGVALALQTIADEITSAGPARPGEETVVAYRWDSNLGGRRTSNIWCPECNAEFQQPGTADADLTAQDVTPGQTCDVCGKDILTGRLPGDH